METSGRINTESVVELQSLTLLQLKPCRRLAHEIHEWHKNQPDALRFIVPSGEIKPDWFWSEPLLFVSFVGFESHFDCFLAKRETRQLWHCPVTRRCWRSGMCNSSLAGWRRFKSIPIGALGLACAFGFVAAAETITTFPLTLSDRFDRCPAGLPQSSKRAASAA